MKNNENKNKPYRAKPVRLQSFKLGDENIGRLFYYAEDVERERREAAASLLAAQEALRYERAENHVNDGCPHDEMEQGYKCLWCGWIDWKQRAEAAEKKLAELQNSMESAEDITELLERLPKAEARVKELQEKIKTWADDLVIPHKQLKFCLCQACIVSREMREAGKE